MFIVQVQYNFPHIFLCPSYPFLLVTSGQGADQRTVFTSCRGPKKRIKNSKTKTQTERERVRLRRERERVRQLKRLPRRDTSSFFMSSPFPFLLSFSSACHVAICVLLVLGSCTLLSVPLMTVPLFSPFPRCSVSGFFQLPFRSLFPDSRFPLPDLPSHLTWQLFNLI